MMLGFFARLFGTKPSPSVQPKSDPERLAAIWKQMYEQGWTSEGCPPFPVVSLEDFFTGNHEEGSMAVNVAGMKGEPTHAMFREVLSAIKLRPEVQDVLVALNPASDEEEFWPGSEAVYILACAKEEQVREWVAAIKPDDVWEGYYGPPPLRAPTLQPGVRVWCIWWD
jgi:hypothetical protein